MNYLALAFNSINLIFCETETPALATRPRLAGRLATSATTPEGCAPTKGRAGCWTASPAGRSDVGVGVVDVAVPSRRVQGGSCLPPASLGNCNWSLPACPWTGLTWATVASAPPAAAVACTLLGSARTPSAAAAAGCALAGGGRADLPVGPAPWLAPPASLPPACNDSSLSHGEDEATNVSS